MQEIEVEQELKNISKWLNSNKFVLNLDKAVQMGVTLAANASDSICFNSRDIEKETVCKYLEILVDSKHSFGSHIEEVKRKLGKQCGINAKLRHFVPKKLLIQYYESEVRPIVQYGVLVYGCFSYPLLLPIHLLKFKVYLFQKQNRFM